jgi:hypothetical protein
MISKLIVPIDLSHISFLLLPNDQQGKARAWATTAPFLYVHFNSGIPANLDRDG